MHSVRRVVVVSALGYFVDILDLFLFNVVRQPSLRDLGVPSAESMLWGMRLLNAQMVGVLIGAFVWGMLGDRLGRLRALYGSILLYSLGTLANGLVGSVMAYAACRFVSGLGLAGELGAAITLVSETLPQKQRGLGTTIVAGFGLCGCSRAACRTRSCAGRAPGRARCRRGLASVCRNWGTAPAARPRRARTRICGRGP